MKKLNLLFFKKKKKIEDKGIDNNDIDNSEIDKYLEIGKLIKESRIQKNISLKELSKLSRIPESTLNAIENNDNNLIPKYPFIKSILVKLEVCLSLQKDQLVNLSSKEEITLKKNKKNYVLGKIDFFNTWRGTTLYFLLLVISLFIINRYFISNFNIIEIQIINEKDSKN